MASVHDALTLAEAHGRAHDWDAAGVEYARAAGIAGKAGDRAASRQAWEAAGEAWRRADRPLQASQALGLALELSPEGPQAALCRLKLAGVLGELGESETAARLAEDAAAALPSGPLHALALDTCIEAAHAIGDRPRGRRWHELLRTHVASLPPEVALAMAVGFRDGQGARLDGDLVEASANFATVIGAAEAIDDAGPAAAAAEAELAEIALLRGEYADALAMWDQAVTQFSAVGRRGLDARAEAGRVRAQIEVGVQPMLHALDDALVFAEQRQMVVLEADLRIARGMGRAATDPAGSRLDFERAISIADRLGHAWRAGRARLERVRRHPGPDDIAELERAEADLAGNEPYRWRCAALRAIRLAGPEGKALAMTALARFEAMDMEPDAANLRARVL